MGDDQLHRVVGVPVGCVSSSARAGRRFAAAPCHVSRQADDHGEDLSDAVNGVIGIVATKRTLGAEHGGAMSHCPCAGGERAGVGIGTPPSPLAAGDVVEQGRESGFTCVGVRWVVGSNELWAEHQVEHAGVAFREVSVRAGEGKELIERLPWSCLLQRPRQMIGEPREAIRRDRCQQTGFVTEVMGRRRVRHPGPAGDLAQAHGARTVLIDRRGTRLHQCPTEVSPEVFPDPPNDLV
jgi:hypothetical protein